MANWAGVNQAMESGFNMGQKTGGKLSGLGIALKGIADKLTQQRQTGEALDTLGQTEQIKQMYSPKEWQPKTKEEALAYEAQKEGFKNQPEAIVDKTGNVIGSRPAHSVFQPSASIEDIIGALGTGGGLPTLKANPQVNQPTNTGRIMVVSPDGKKGSIPQEQLQEAIKAGYKRTL